MTQRTIHIGASFAIVLVAHLLYAQFALPWIEPAAVARIHSQGGPLPETQPLHLHNKELQVLFGPDSWQLRDAHIITSNSQALLLWQKYKNGADGWVELFPLTIVLVTDDTVLDAAERYRHAVVMEVPEGANLKFDQPLDLNRNGIGRLIGGRLRGPVQIRSRGKRPDRQDDLLVTTRDVDLSEQRIATASDVDFRWGLHSGRGRQMEIRLLPRLGPRVANQAGPNIGGIEQVRFEHIERLHLDMGAAPAAGPKDAPAQMAGLPMPGLASPGGPIDVACRGPFHIHLVDQVATFRDHVDVMRAQPNGPSDRMSCDLLSIYFERPKPGEAAKAKPAAPGFDLQPARIEARGAPATIHAPIAGMQAQAELLQYDLRTGQIQLNDSREVVLRKDANEIHTQGLRYTPGPPGRPGMFHLLAAGAGWLRGEMASRPGQQLEARWRESLEVRPHDQNQVISLTGGAKLAFQAMGQLDAREVHFWLRELPPTPAGQSAFQPDRLLAEGDVVGASPQLSSRVQRLEVWFSSPPPPAGTPSASPGAIQPAGRATAAVGSGPALTPYVPSTAGTPANASVANPTPSSNPLNPSAAPGRQAHLEITGRLLRAKVLLRDQEHGDLTEVTVVENVRLQETRTAAPGDQPLLVTGQWLQATDASSPGAKVKVTGEPAHLEGRGMGLTGPNIAIDRGANTVTMEGPGVMEKLLDRDLENRPLAQGSTVRIDWQKGMTFDGRKARFHDAVKVKGASQLLETGWMEIHFQRAINFTDAQSKEPPTVERLLCGDGVFVENRTLEAGQPVSYDRISLKNLDLNNISGEFHADGPGWVVSVRRGGNQSFSLPGGPLAGPARNPSGASRVPARTAGLNPVPSPSADPNQLTCLHLQFMKSITGNKIRKDLAFHGQVLTRYAPVTQWTAKLESDDPNRLGPGAVVLHCENLTVNDMSPVSGSAGRNLELAALENVIAEGTNFTARSARLSYAQAKELLILEGDGRSDAELFKQEGEGRQASRFAAQKILYFLKTNQVNIDGVRSLEMNQAPGGRMTPGR